MLQIWGVSQIHKAFSIGAAFVTDTRHFLLLTATPHNGKEEDFHFLCR